MNTHRERSKLSNPGFQKPDEDPNPPGIGDGIGEEDGDEDVDNEVDDEEDPTEEIEKQVKHPNNIGCCLRDMKGLPQFYSVG
jgi:hypothetical protein